MSDTIMAEEVQPEKKVAFAHRKYSNEERIKKDEEELEQLIAEQKGEVKEEEPQEAEPTNAEEKSFKKRYGDLRRHMQEKEKSWEEKFNTLESQLKDVTRKEIKLPKSDEDIEAWATQYPDVAAIVETIAIKKAREQAAGLEDRVKEIDEMKATASREKAEVELPEGIIETLKRAETPETLVPLVDHRRAGSSTAGLTLSIVQCSENRGSVVGVQTKVLDLNACLNSARSVQMGGQI